MTQERDNYMDHMKWVSIVKFNRYLLYFYYEKYYFWFYAEGAKINGRLSLPSINL